MIENKTMDATDAHMWVKALSYEFIKDKVRLGQGP